MWKSAILLSIAFNSITCKPLQLPINDENGNLIKSKIQKNLEFVNLFSAENDPAIACYRIPAIITASNGDLLVAIDERVPSCGDLKWSDDINIVMRRSHDNGKTWTATERIVDEPLGEAASDPSMILDSETDEIFLFYNYMNHFTEKNVYYLKLIRSKDNGKTWSSPKDITSQITKPDWKNDFKFITSGRGTQTIDGRLLHTLVNIEKGLHVFGSNDHGENWYLIENSILPADESKIIELANGNWMINSRVKDAGHRYIHISSDEGQTWETTKDTSLVDPACNASIIRYPAELAGDDKNRLIFCNANSSSSRTNLTLRLSYDEGQSWSSGKTIYSGAAAYSTISILENGDIGIVFEKDEYKENVFLNVSLDWLTDKEDVK